MKKKEKSSLKNRLHPFEGRNGMYLYDAFSQNLYPVSKAVVDFFFSDADTYSEQENKEIQNFCDYLLKWDGTIRERNTGECHVTINMSNRCKMKRELNPLCSAIKNAPEKFIESYFELKNKAALV